ncbi:MAG: NAD(P)/FAD-dependent oxidoreductase [Reyranellaceae bacterium]
MSDRPVHRPGMEGGLWAATAAAAPDLSPLEGDLTADVVVVGGGFTGLSTALHTAERGLSVVLLEAGEIGSGASGRNGGQVIPGLKMDPRELRRDYGQDMGSRIVKLSGGAADLVFDLIRRHAMDCPAKQGGWIQGAHSKIALKSALARAEDWLREGAPADILDKKAIADETGHDFYEGGWIDRRAGQVNPLAYARGLARAAVKAGARLFVQSRASAIEKDGDGWRVRTAKGSVRAGQVALCTDAYSDDLWPGLRTAQVPVKSVQIATAPLGHNVRKRILPGGAVVSETRKLAVYYRLDADGRLLMGGRGPMGEHVGNATLDTLVRTVNRLWPFLDAPQYEYAWSGTVGLTLDHMPHLCRLAPGVITGLGYNGRGVAMTTAMGTVLAKSLAGTPDAELDLPLSTLPKVPLFEIRKPFIAMAIQYHRLRDAMGLPG